MTEEPTLEEILKDVNVTMTTSIGGANMPTKAVWDAMWNDMASAIHVDPDGDKVYAGTMGWGMYAMLIVALWHSLSVGYTKGTVETLKRMDVADERMAMRLILRSVEKKGDENADQA